MLFYGLQEDFHAVEHKDLAFTRLTDLIGAEQLEFAGALVVVVLDADAASPLLDLTFRGPDTDVNGIRAVED